MTLSKIAAILTISIFSISATAQDQPQVKIGNNGVPHGIYESRVAETISVADFKRDAIIHIRDGRDNYIIEHYSISFLQTSGNLIGPLAINKERVAGDISNMMSLPKATKYAQPDTRIFIENLTAKCTTCADEKTVTVKAFSIKLKE